MRETKRLNGWNGERSKRRMSKFWTLIERFLSQAGAFFYESAEFQHNPTEMT